MKDENTTGADTSTTTEQEEMKGKDDRKDMKEEMKELMQKRLKEISEGESAFNIEEFLGKRTTIEKAVIDSGEYGDMIKAETEVLGTFKEENGEELDIRGSVLFSIYYDEDGAMKYRPKSKLAKFLVKHKLKSVADLIGCEVLTTVKSTDKGDFIGFV